MEQGRKARNKPMLIWSINLQQRRQEYAMVKNLFKKWCWENWIAKCKRIKLNFFLTPYTKINSKWIKDLNVRSETIKLLGENTGSMIFDIGLSKIFLDLFPQTRETKARINWTTSNFPSFWKIRKLPKGQPDEWEKVFAKYIYDKGLISKLYKEFIQVNIKKTNNPIKKWTEDPNRYFSKDIQMANRHMKMLSITRHQGYAIQNHNEIPPHTRQNYYHQKARNNKCWQGCGEKGTLMHCWWDCRLVQPLWKTVWSFLKKIRTAIWSSNFTSRYLPEENKTLIWKDIRTPMFTAALFSVVKICKQPKCPLIDEWIKKM